MSPGFAIAWRRLCTAVLVCQRLTGRLNTTARHFVCHHWAQVGHSRTGGVLFRWRLADAWRFAGLPSPSGHTAWRSLWPAIFIPKIAP